MADHDFVSTLTIRRAVGYNRPIQATSLRNVYDAQQVLAELLLQNIPNRQAVVQALAP